MSAAAPTEMEEGTRAPDDDIASVAWRMRLAAVLMALTALVFRQAPGLIVPDTKLDLTANPGGFLTRALSLWDDDAFGQLQNQAYGYLFPVGPFHGALISLGVPEWIVQRLWWSVVLGAAFLGCWRLCNALDVGRPWVRLLGAVLYALTPRMLGEVTVTSVEVWPIAIAPWILAPLVDRAPMSTRARLLRSAVAVGCLGGVNAVASAAALIPAGLWWLTRRPSLALLRSVGAWSGLVLAATSWWIGPLLLLGRFSPPFLSWIEDAQVTTGTASPFNAIQGTSAWLGFLAGADGPSWPGAWRFVTLPLLIVLSGGVGVLGTVGLLDRRLPERRWLVVTFVVGLLLLTLGYAGAGSGPFTEPIRALLDGPLAPLRNIHKFELVIRIPVLLGFVVAVTRVADWRVTQTLPSYLGGLVPALLVVAIAGPGVAATLPRAGAYAAIPDYWREAATWLDTDQAPGSVLVVPASPFADFSWGSTKDEPFQAILRRPIAVRDAVPLGSAGATRWLDEVGRLLSAGRGDAGLALALRNAGVGFVVVRNDLTFQAQGAVPLAVHQALDDAGLTRAAAFGPPAGSPAETPDQTLAEHLFLPYPSLEVYAVGQASGAQLTPASALNPGLAGAEDVASLGGAGLPTMTYAVGAADATAASGLVLTDGNRRRELAFGLGNGATSEVLTAAAEPRSGRRTIDVIDPAAPQTTLQWGGGVTAVRASSSASSSTATLRIGPGSGPAAALDGDSQTEWTSGDYGQAVGQWLEVEFDAPRDVTGLALLPGLRVTNGSSDSVIRVVTDTGASATVVSEIGSFTTLTVPAGATRTVRIVLDDVKGSPAGFSVAELRIPGLAARPWLTVPDPGDRLLAAVHFRMQNPGRDGCAFAQERPLCSPRLVTDPEEAAGIFRRFTTGQPQSFSWTGTVIPRGGPELWSLLDLPGRAVVRASSQAVQAAAARPAAVLDADLGTGWVAAPTDLDPTLTLTLPSARTLTGVQLLVDQYLAGARARSVRIQAAGLDEVVPVDDQGYARFGPTTTSTLVVHLRDPQPVDDIDILTGWRTQLPVGVSELSLLGADDLRQPLAPDTTVRTVCGFGPTVSMDGQSVVTEVVGTVRQVLRGMPMTWRACGTAADSSTGRTPGSVELAAGGHTLEAPATLEFRPLTLSLRADAMTPTTAPVEALEHPATGSWTVPARDVESVLVLAHNANPGFAAHDGGGAALTPVRIAGWQQGWLLPPGPATTVTEDFGPQRLYVVLILGGGVAALMVFAAALRWARRPGTGASLPPARGERSRIVLAVCAVVALGAAYGLLGVLALAYAAAGYAVLRGRHRAGLIALAGLPGTLAVVLVAAAPWTHGDAALRSPGAQLGVLAMAAVVVTSAAWGEPGEPGESGESGPWSRPQRMIGRSTKR